jgi:hypothetical protein
MIFRIVSTGNLRRNFEPHIRSEMGSFGDVFGIGSGIGRNGLSCVRCLKDHLSLHFEIKRQDRSGTAGRAGRSSGA